MDNLDAAAVWHKHFPPVALHSIYDSRRRSDVSNRAHADTLRPYGHASAALGITIAATKGKGEQCHAYHSVKTDKERVGDRAPEARG
jgi:hypothetical protein